MKELSIVAIVIDNLEVTQRFVSSIRQYTKVNYELILIDNSSKDKKTIDFLKKSSDKYFRFDERVSVSRAWNKGVELSSGNYICVANNDTVVPPNWFEPLKETLDKNKKVGLISPLTFWLIRGSKKYGNLKNFNFNEPFKLVKFKDIVWGEFLIYKRKAFEEVGGFNEEYKGASGEDLEMNFQLYSKNYEILVDPRVFVYHQGNASQIESIISKKEKDKLWKRNFELFKSRWPEYTKGW